MCSRLILSGRSWYDKGNGRTALTESTVEMSTLPTVWQHSAGGVEMYMSTEVSIRPDVDVSIDVK
jgi:hypothetical protein